MKETINKLTEKQIALITLALTVVALVIGIALPEIRAALGLEQAGRGSHYRSERAARAEEEVQANAAEMESEQGIPLPPAPPGAKKTLARTELKEDYSNSGAQTGEFVVFSGVTFTNTGFLKGKVVIEKGGIFKNTGAIEGEVINKGGKFENTGYLDGPLTVQ